MSSTNLAIDFATGIGKSLRALVKVGHDRFVRVTFIVPFCETPESDFLHSPVCLSMCFQQELFLFNFVSMSRLVTMDFTGEANRFGLFFLLLSELLI